MMGLRGRASERLNEIKVLQMELRGMAFGAQTLKGL